MTLTPAYCFSSSRQYCAIFSVRFFSSRPLPTAPESQPPWPASKTKTLLRVRMELLEASYTADSRESNEAPESLVYVELSPLLSSSSDSIRYEAALLPTENTWPETSSEKRSIRPEAYSTFDNENAPALLIVDEKR